MSLDDTIEVLTARWPLFAATGATLVGVTVVRHLYRWSVLNSIPMLGEELGSSDKRRAAYTTGAKKMYEDGYNKVSTNHLHPGEAAFVLTLSRCSSRVPSSG